MKSKELNSKRKIEKYISDLQGSAYRLTSVILSCRPASGEDASFTCRVGQVTNPYAIPVKAEAKWALQHHIWSGRRKHSTSQYFCCTWNRFNGHKIRDFLYLAFSPPFPLCIKVNQRLTGEQVDIEVEGENGQLAYQSSIGPKLLRTKLRAVVIIAF